MKTSTLLWLVAGIVVLALLYVVIKKTTQTVGPHINDFDRPQQKRAVAAVFSDVDFSQGDFALYIKHKEHGEFMVLDQQALLENQNNLRIKRSWINFVPGEGDRSFGVMLFKDHKLLDRLQGGTFKIFEIGNLKQFSLPVQSHRYQSVKADAMQKLAELTADRHNYIISQPDFPEHDREFSVYISFPSMAVPVTQELDQDGYQRILTYNGVAAEQWLAEEESRFDQHWSDKIKTCISQKAGAGEFDIKVSKGASGVDTLFNVATGEILQTTERHPLRTENFIYYDFRARIVANQATAERLSKLDYSNCLTDAERNKDLVLAELKRLVRKSTLPQLDVDNGEVGISNYQDTTKNPTGIHQHTYDIEWLAVQAEKESSPENRQTLGGRKMETVTYNNQLKKLQWPDLAFNAIALEDLPAPFYCDYSHHESETARNYKSWDKLGFRDILLQQLQEKLGEQVLKLIIITPRQAEAPYDAFAFLTNKEIAPLNIANQGNWREWLDIIFADNYDRLAEYHANGQFERQPELNRNPQFMLTLSKGNFSVSWANSGMMIDEKPYENSGAYLHKKAPQQYNEAKIAREKNNYLKKYIDTSGAEIDPTALKAAFEQLVQQRQLSVVPPFDNSRIYQQFEAEAGFAMPQELQQLCAWHNGLKNSGFLSAKQVLDEWRNWKGIYADPNWMLIDLKSHTPDGQKTIGIYTTPWWIPIFHDGAGNFLAIDYAPGKKGRSGQIIAFGADEIKIRWIADNMLDLLQQLGKGDDVLQNGY